MRKIALTGKNGLGKFALISDADVEQVIKYRWWLHKYGYPTSRVNGRNIELHKFIMGEKRGYYIDHKNLNRLDNQRDNLRFVTFRQNLVNSAPRNNRQYKGVYWDKTKRRWQVVINTKERRHSFGRYKTPEEAAKVYDQHAKELLGEYAWLNFPV